MDSRFRGNDQEGFEIASKLIIHQYTPMLE